METEIQSRILAAPPFLMWEEGGLPRCEQLMPEAHDPSEEPSHYWTMVRAFLTLKDDREPVPVFDEKGRSIGLGQLWGVDGQNQLRGTWCEGPWESPTFLDGEDDAEDDYQEEWGEEVLMVEPIRCTSEELADHKALGEARSPWPIVWWEDVEEAAELVFDHRPGGAGLQTIWSILVQQGYATYANEWERARVLLRFLTAGLLWKTSLLPGKHTDAFPLDEYQCAWVTNRLGLSPVRLGWLAGTMHVALPGATAEHTEFELTTQLLPHLAEKMRPEVVQILLQQVGGQESFCDFFYQHGKAWTQDVYGREEPPSNTLVDETGCKQAMARWVQAGCPFPANWGM